MTRLGRALARAAVRLHPRLWRARYEDEVADLVDESDSSLADAADLARSAWREHLNGGAPMRFEPAYRHPSAFALAAGLLLLPTLAVVALSLLGHELGLGAVATVTDPWVAWIDTVRPVDLALVARSARCVPRRADPIAGSAHRARVRGFGRRRARARGNREPRRGDAGRAGRRGPRRPYRDRVRAAGRRLARLGYGVASQVSPGSRATTSASVASRSSSGVPARIGNVP